MGSWSHTNAAISAALQRQLPRWEVRTVDLLDRFKRDKLLLLSSALDIPYLALHAARCGGYDKTNILYAPNTARAFNRLAHKAVEEHRPELTLQTTTRFNAATGKVPHFTVTDITLGAGRQNYRKLYHANEAALALLDNFQRKVFGASTGVFALGEYVRRSLIDDYQVPPQRAFAIGAGPNIVLGERSQVVANKKVLFVGSDWVRKGGPQLLEAFLKIRPKHPDAVLEIVGVTPEVSVPGVSIIGRVPREQLHHYLSDARIFALPSVLEAFGIAFVEALHFGLPIVASSVGAIPEVVRDGVNGFLVAPGDSGAMAEALDKLLSSDDLAMKYGEASYQLARRFTWTRAGSIIRDEMFKLANIEQPSSAESSSGRFGDGGLKFKASG
jgi:glycosyltransferase involved in cell wall biosynthesis